MSLSIETLRAAPIQFCVSSKELSNFIAKIQLLEEQKLRLTVDHQLASQQALDDPDDELLDRNAKGIKKKLTELAQEIR